MIDPGRAGCRDQCRALGRGDVGRGLEVSSSSTSSSSAKNFIGAIGVKSLGASQESARVGGGIARMRRSLLKRVTWRHSRTHVECQDR